MEVRGADANLGLPRLAIFVEDARLLLAAEGLLHNDCGPVDSRSPMEKERLGGDPTSSNVAACGGRGEEATLDANLYFVASDSSSSALMPWSNSSWADFTGSRAEIRTGVYLRSGYTRRMGFGMFEELRLLPAEASSAVILGVK